MKLAIHSFIQKPCIVSILHTRLSNKDLGGIKHQRALAYITRRMKHSLNHLGCSVVSLGFPFFNGGKGSL